MASLPANTGGNKRRVSYFYDGEELIQLKEATLLVGAFGPAVNPLSNDRSRSSAGL